jgi:hypothetical protein
VVLAGSNEQNDPGAQRGSLFGLRILEESRMDSIWDEIEQTLVGLYSLPHNRFDLDPGQTPQAGAKAKVAQVRSRLTSVRREDFFGANVVPKGGRAPSLMPRCWIRLRLPIREYISLHRTENAY